MTLSILKKDTGVIMIILLRGLREVSTAWLIKTILLRGLKGSLDCVASLSDKSFSLRAHSEKVIDCRVALSDKEKTGIFSRDTESQRP